MSYRELLTLDAELGIPEQGAADEYGNPAEVYTWHAGRRCHLARSSSTEDPDNLAADTITAYFDPDDLELGLDSASRLRAAGAEWELAGEPIVARHPRTWRLTVSATVRRAEVR